MVLSIELSKQMNFLRSQVLNTYPDNQPSTEKAFNYIMMSIMTTIITDKVEDNAQITTTFNNIQDSINTLQYLTVDELTELEEIIYDIFVRLLALAEFIQGYKPANNLFRLVTHRLDIIYVMKHKDIILKTFNDNLIS